MVASRDARDGVARRGLKKLMLLLGRMQVRDPAPLM
jgi:hypothetical protein